MTINDILITVVLTILLYPNLKNIYDMFFSKDLSLKESESLMNKYVDLELTKRYIIKKPIQRRIK